MTNPTPHGQVPEALIDLIDAYAETRHRCGGIYNAKTEAARKAVIEALSGVQALSAAPAGLLNAARMAMDVLDWHATSDKTIPLWKRQQPALEALRAALAASPTPPAEQQAANKAAPAPLSDDVVKDAARWRWLSEHIGVAWNEGKFTSLVRIVSDKNRTALNASIDRMMAGDWSDAALAAQGGD